MSNYKRLYVDGGCYFFTLVTFQRKPVFDCHSNVELLKMAFRHVMQTYPFAIDAIVILPDHLHCIWTLPENDSNYSLRWRLIKSYFSRKQQVAGDSHGCKPVWQSRFWEHLIRSEEDYKNHLDYIHYNPVKHGYVNAPTKWPYSSFKRYQENGCYDVEWGVTAPIARAISDMELE